jgi:hypothetical protein
MQGKRFKAHIIQVLHATGRRLVVKTFGCSGTRMKMNRLDIDQVNKAKISGLEIRHDQRPNTEIFEVPLITISCSELTIHSTHPYLQHSHSHSTRLESNSVKHRVTKRCVKCLKPVGSSTAQQTRKTLCELNLSAKDLTTFKLLLQSSILQSSNEIAS